MESLLTRGENPIEENIGLPPRAVEGIFGSRVDGDRKALAKNWLTRRVPRRV